MAIYINLGVDCGVSPQVAHSIDLHFRGLTFGGGEIAGVACEVWTTRHLGHWLVGVWPRGLGWATPGFDRPEELLDYEPQIRDAIYRRLSAACGYRRALFGHEAFDVLAAGTAAGLMEIGVTGMVYAEAEFPGGVPGGTVGPFARGYSIVLGVGEAPGSAPDRRDTSASRDA